MRTFDHPNLPLGNVADEISLLTIEANDRIREFATPARA
jgi:hypothetical protein